MPPRERMVPRDGTLPLPEGVRGSLWTPRLAASSIIAPRKPPLIASKPKKRKAEPIKTEVVEKSVARRSRATRSIITRERLLPKSSEARKVGRPKKVIGEREVRKFEDPASPAYFIPTQDQRNIVETGVTNGIFHKDIRKLILNPATGKPIDKRTFREVFKYELRVGHTTQRMAVARSVYHQAVGQDAIYDDEGRTIRPAMAPNLAAAKWYEMTRFGLKEGAELTFIDAEGNAVPRAPSGNVTNIGQVVFVMPKNGFETRDMKDITPQLESLPAPEGEDADTEAA